MPYLSSAYQTEKRQSSYSTIPIRTRIQIFFFLFCGAYLEDGNERANVYGGGSERIDSAPGVFNPMRYPWTRNPLSPWTLFGKFSLN